MRALNVSRALPLVALVLLTALLAGGCGGGGDSSETETGPVEPAGEGSLTVTRPDGTTFSLDEATVFCGPSSTETERPAIYVRTPDPSDDRPFFSLEAIVEDVQEQAVLEFPSTYIESQPEGGVLFLYDPDGGTDGPNELNSTYEDSTGSIRFRSVECDPEPAIDFTVSGEIDSEFGNLEPVRVEGGFRVGG